MTQYIGVDPGKSGSIAIMSDSEITTIRLSETEHDIWNNLSSIIRIDAVVTIESVHAMPKQGVTSSFTFGKNYGFVIGLLTASLIPIQYVTPQKWQKAMGCLSKGDKNVTKAAAQRLWPKLKITHANADALLIMEYGRKYVWHNQN